MFVFLFGFRNVTDEKARRPSSGMIKVSLLHTVCHDSRHVERARGSSSMVAIAGLLASGLTSANHSCIRHGLVPARPTWERPGM